MRINDKYLEVDKFAKEIENLGKNKLQKVKSEFSNVIAKLDTLSPLKTLVRGYSITEKGGKVISSSNDLKSGDCLNLRFIDGSKEAVVK